MPRAVRRGVRSALMSLAALCLAQAAPAAPIRFHLFNLNPDHAYDVRVDGTEIASPYSGPAGSVVVGMDAVAGSIVSVSDEGAPDLQPPAPPVFASLDAGLPGCADAEWIPSGDPTVVGYVVSHGRTPADGGVPTYEHSIEVGASSALEVCALEHGMHYFAVQSRNYAGMLSAYSTERAVQIFVVSVMFASLDARVVDGGVVLSWDVEADEPVLGFRVYRTGPDGGERLLTPEAIAPEEQSFTDRSAQAGTQYAYFVAVVREGGDEMRSFAVPVTVPALTLALEQNVPNPFNPATTIPFVLDATSRVLLRVYDVRGAHVATLLDGVLPGGRHRIAWDGRNDGGRPVSSGTYLYSLVAGRQRLSRKMLMVR